MKFKQRTNDIANILDEIFNLTDSLIHSKVMDLNNSNNVKKKLANKKGNQPSLSTVPEGIFYFVMLVKYGIISIPFLAEKFFDYLFFPFKILITRMLLNISMPPNFNISTIQFVLCISDWVIVFANTIRIKTHF